MAPTLFVSPVGTSLLTNAAPLELSRVLRETANLKEGEIDSASRQLILLRANEIEEKIRTSDVKGICRLSAELNGIYSYHEVKPLDRKDIHFLIASDTFQGALTADIVRRHLEEKSASVTILQQSNLSTRDHNTFSSAIKELLKSLAEIVPEYSEQGYKVVFNLVGGFKSVQGYLNTVGMLYADEIIYIFEAESSALIRIPRLPLQVDNKVMKENASLFARLALGEYIATAEEVSQIPEAFLDNDGTGAATLSAWGLLLWTQQKKEILGKGPLLQLPGLRYERSFLHDFESWSNVAEKVTLQETLVKVSRLWSEGGLAKLRQDGGLQYKTQNNRGNIGEFRVTQALRVTCLPAGSNLFLRRFGGHEIYESP